MNALFLVVLLSITPARWDGHVWNAMDVDAQLSYVSGFMGGLEVGGMLTRNNTLPIRGIPLEYIVAELDLFYIVEDNLDVSIPAAILIRGKRSLR